jgi:hypothetical protein
MFKKGLLKVEKKIQPSNENEGTCDDQPSFTIENNFCWFIFIYLFPRLFQRNWDRLKNPFLSKHN